MKSGMNEKGYNELKEMIQEKEIELLRKHCPNIFKLKEPKTEIEFFQLYTNSAEIFKYIMIRCIDFDDKTMDIEKFESLTTKVIYFLSRHFNIDLDMQFEIDVDIKGMLEKSQFLNKMLHGFQKFVEGMEEEKKDSEKNGHEKSEMH